MEEHYDVADIPDEFKALRACLVCGLVKTMSQFHEHGCENCEKFLQMEGNTARVHEVYDFFVAYFFHCHDYQNLKTQCHKVTTAYFEGLISMIDPQKSWVAKWQRMHTGSGTYCTGMYAIDVVGELPIDVVDYCEEKGLEYKARKKQ